MRKKNLLLSLICSVCLAIAIVAVTVFTFVKPINNNNENNGNGQNVNPISDITEKIDYDAINDYDRNGSEQFPYIIYSTESYNKLLKTYGAEIRLVTEPIEDGVDEKGNVKYKKDDKNHTIFEPVLDEQGNQKEDVYYFEFANDVDFNGIEYVTLFNNGKAFIGHINGNNFTLKNVTIDVDAKADSLVDKFSFESDDLKYSHIGLFGDLDGAEIKNLKIDNLKIDVECEVYNYISGFNGSVYSEVTVGSIAAIAKNSTIENVKLYSNIAASSYVDSESKNNAVGGVFGVENDVEIKDLDAEINVLANAGTNYLVGGVAGYGFNSKIENAKLRVSVQSKFSSNLNIAGLFGYAKGFSVINSDVDFNVSDVSSVEEKNAFISNLPKTTVSKLVNGEYQDVSIANLTNATKIAGLICSVRANDNSQKGIISNVSVNSNVDFAGVFAGVILDVYSTAKTDYSLVTITDVIVSSNARALAVHGFARQLIAATVSYSADKTSAENYCNLKLTGDSKLTEYYDGVRYDAVSLFTSVKINYISWNNGYKNLFVKISSALKNELRQLDKSRNSNLYGDFKIIAE